MVSLGHNKLTLYPSDTIWHHRTWWTLIQVMACCLVAKPLPGSMLTYHQEGQMTFIWVQFHKKYSSLQSLEFTWKLLILKFQTSQGLMIIICMQWIVIYSVNITYDFKAYYISIPFTQSKYLWSSSGYDWNGSTEQEFNIQFVYMTGVGVGGCVGYV